MQWRITGIGGTGDSSVITLNDDSMFTTTEGTPDSVLLGGDTSVNFEDFSSGFFQFSLGSTSIASQTITGTGATGSYAGFSSGNKTRFEGLGGQTVPIFGGTSFSGLSVSIVPEPYEASMVFGLILLSFSLWRKRSRLVKA